MNHDDEDKTVQAGAPGTGGLRPDRPAPPPESGPPSMLALVAALVVVIALAWLWQSGTMERYMGPGDDDAKPVAEEERQPDPVGDKLDEEAERYVEELQERAEEEEIDVRDADGFIGVDSAIRISGDSADCVNYDRNNLEAELGLPLEAEVLLWTEHEKVIYRTVEEILSIASEEGSAAGVPLWRDGEVQPVSLERFREDYGADMQQSLAVLGTEMVSETVTVAEIASAGADGDTVCVTADTNPETVTLRQLMPGANPDDLYYVYTVGEDDVQGLWGIIHRGIIDNFARGISLRHEGRLDTYQVQIPQTADERVSETESSFLGQVIDRKVDESFVYNHERNRMGVNPDILVPGQEIVMIRFTREEMIDIYKHFASGGQQ